MKKTSNNKRIGRITAGLCLAVALTFLIFSPISSAIASNPTPNSNNNNVVLTVEPPVETPEPLNTPDPGSGTTTTTNINTTTTNITKHFIQFDTGTLREALVNSGVQMMCSLISGRNCELTKVVEVADTEGVINNLIDDQVKILAGIGPNGIDVHKDLEDTRKSLWGIMLRISLVMIPVSLVVTLSSAMKDGMSSVISYSNAREAAIEWLVSVVLMGSSLLLINIGIKASSLITSGIFEMVDAQYNLFGAGSGLGRAFFGDLMIQHVTTMAVSPLAALFLLFFKFFLMVALVGTLIISSMSQSVGMLLMTAIAPLLYILSSLKPLAWLKGLWLKVVIVLLLIPPINMLLITMGTLLVKAAYANKSFSLQSFGSLLFGIFASIGVVSVLITVNAAVGKMVYGAAMQVAEKAWGATKQVLALAVAAAGAGVGAAAGAGAAGAGAGAGAGADAAAAGASSEALPSAAASTSTSTPSSLPGSGSGASPSLPSTTNTPKFPASPSSSSSDAAKGNFSSSAMRPNRNAELVNKIGSVLKASGNPVLGSFGSGMQLGTSMSSSGSGSQGQLSEHSSGGITSAAMREGFSKANEDIKQNNYPNEGVSKFGRSFDAFQAQQHVGMDAAGLAGITNGDLVGPYLAPNGNDPVRAAGDFARMQNSLYQLDGKDKSMIEPKGVNDNYKAYTTTMGAMARIDHMGTLTKQDYASVMVAARAHSKMQKDGFEGTDKELRSFGTSSDAPEKVKQWASDIISRLPGTH